MMVNGMNGGGHAAMANWALSSVEIGENDHILDIGCGGGANIARLLQRAPKGVVQGIDYSSVSVAKSSKVNAKAIAEAKMLLHIRQDLSLKVIADMLGFGEQASFSRYFKHETGVSPTEFRALE
jgi:cyclopropane fatty-acyl-phospholipid synthase-like methyltransferase